MNPEVLIKSLNVTDRHAYKVKHALRTDELRKKVLADRKDTPVSTDTLWS